MLGSLLFTYQFVSEWRFSTSHFLSKVARLIYNLYRYVHVNVSNRIAAFIK